MNKNQIWKLIFILLIIGVCFGLVSPFSDRELGEYALGQVTSEANESNHVGYETFAEVIETIRNQIPDDEAIDFLKLRILVQPIESTMQPFFNHRKVCLEQSALDYSLLSLNRYPRLVISRIVKSETSWFFAHF